MKTLMLSAALVVGATAAFAADFDNNAVNLTLERDNMTFGLETTAGEATALTFGVAVLPHSVAGADADLTLGVDYGIVTEDFTLSAAYGLSKTYGQVNVYGSTEAAYTIASGESDGNWEATPTLGAAYIVNDQLNVYSEVSYTWDASNDWAREGGSVELGARYELTADLSVTPSLVRSFDTGADETNLNLEVGVSF